MSILLDDSVTKAHSACGVGYFVQDVLEKCQERNIALSSAIDLLRAVIEKIQVETANPQIDPLGELVSILRVQNAAFSNFQSSRFDEIGQSVVFSRHSQADIKRELIQYWDAQDDRLGDLVLMLAASDSGRVHGTMQNSTGYRARGCCIGFD